MRPRFVGWFPFAVAASFVACGGSAGSDPANGQTGGSESGGTAQASGGAPNAAGGANSTGGKGTTGGGPGTGQGVAGDGGQAGEGAGGTAGEGDVGGTSGASQGGSAGTEQGGASSGAGGTARMCTCGSPGCGECPTFNEVTAPNASYTVFATEVTNAQYAAFVAANPPVANQPESCKFNGSFRPANGLVKDKPDHPVVDVDWCDAFAFCHWAGRRLCGKIGGGANNYNDYADPSASQWFSVCSNGGRNDYPYGNVYESTACNGRAYWASDVTPNTVPVGSLAQCVVNGVFDMSGNVYEWEDSCEAESGETDKCRARGGSHYTESAEAHLLKCRSATVSYSRSNSKSTLGFRCCSE